MSQKVIICLYYFLKSFSPFSSFMVPYLIEEKKIKNKTIYNDFNTYFFISSLTVSMIAFLIVNYLGNRLALFIDVLVEILALLILYKMPEGNLIVGRIISIFHGSSTSLNSVLKLMIVSNTFKDTTDRVKTMYMIEILKRMTGVFSSLLGQNIYIYSKNYNINLGLSGITLLLVLFILFFVNHDTNNIPRKNSIISELMSNFNIFTEYKIMSRCMLYITANILIICLLFFSANIFIERRKCTKNRFSKGIFAFFAPLRIFSVLIIKISKFFGCNVKVESDIKENTNKEIVIHGYIDGIAKLCVAILFFLVGSFRYEEKYQTPLAFIMSFFTFIFLFLLYRVDSLGCSYLFFTITFTLASLVKMILFENISQHANKNFLFSLNMFIGSLVHILLSCISMYNELDVKQRFKYYFYVGMAFILSSLILYYY